MSSKPKPVPLKTDITEDQQVLETPDIQSFRNFDPTAQIATIAPTIQAQFDRTRRDQQNTYAYAGISNPVLRARMQNRDAGDINYEQATATGQLFDDAQRRRMDQLGTLANLTARRQTRRTGYQESLPNSNGNSGLWGAIGQIGSTALGLIPSDERMKEDAQPSQPILPRLGGIQTYDYKWKETGEPDAGVMAQEMAQAFPEVVKPGDEQTPWTVNPKAEAELALQGLKELNEKVDKIAQTVLGARSAETAPPARPTRRR